MSERSLRSYLLLPRPGDLVKAWIFPAGFLLGVLAAGGASGEEVLRAAVAWGALELLIYQARYQWNDIRGFAADQRHPDRAARGRLPGPISRGREHIRASALGALGRLGLAALLAVAPLDLAGALLALALAVFGVAALYEALRARCTGSSEEVPPPLTGGILAIWGVVGAGYAIRGLAGLGAAVSFGSAWLPLAAGLTLWAYGIAFVTGRWALEALAFGRLDERGEIAWQVEPGQAREHSLALVRWLPPVTEGEGRGKDGSLGHWRALSSAPLSAPWNLAAVVAGSAAAVTGCLLAGSADPFSVGLMAAGGAVFAAATVAPFHHRWPGLLGSALALFALAVLVGSPRPALAVLPWFAVLGAHLFFAAQSPRTLAHPLRFALASLWDRVPGSRPRRPLALPLARR
ncbi:MAG TPA: hypothetical protein VKA35_06545 [Solirubrobacterales bacterium]|nr:hypothetical protein [Solirubrobacterales bacterium]